VQNRITTTPEPPDKALSAHEREELDAGLLGASRALPGAAAFGAGERPEHRALHLGGTPGLHRRVDNRGNARMDTVARLNHRVSDRATGQAQRVTVTSPRLNGAPVPPIRARTITEPISGARRISISGWCPSAATRAARSTGKARESRPIHSCPALCPAPGISLAYRASSGSSALLTSSASYFPGRSSRKRPISMICN
jgi:hypothetical protein